MLACSSASALSRAVRPIARSTVTLSTNFGVTSGCHRCYHPAQTIDSHPCSQEQRQLPSDFFTKQPAPPSSSLPGPSRNVLFQPTSQARLPESDDKQGGISEQEYRLRVGKACRLLVDTLPDFMQRGVVDLDGVHQQSHPSSPRESRSSPFLGQSLLRRSPWKGKAKAAEPPASLDSIYYPSIAFSFRPPLPHIGLGSTAGELASRGKLPSADHQDSHHSYAPTISFQGRAIYVASSHVLRHALSALLYDTMLAIESARFEGRSQPGACWPGIGSHIASSKSTDSTSSGPDKLTIRLRFEGMTRISSAHHTYTVLFHYEFDRKTGTIGKHTVDKIQPVPGSKVWAGLTTAWGHLSPAGGQGGMVRSKSVKCGTRRIPWQ